MKIFLLLSVAACWSVSAVVSVRLIRLAVRTRGAPELLIGLSLFIGTVVGFVAVHLASAFATSQPALARAVYSIGMIGLGLGTYSTLLAWWQIYHPADRWAKVLVAVWTVLGGVTIAALASVPAPDLTGPVRGERLFLAVAQFVTHGGVFALMAGSGFRYHAPLRRRVRLGLGDPLVANRILAWSVAAAAAMGQYCLAFVVRIVDLGVAGTSLGHALVGALGLVVAFTLVAAFFPPESYKRWIQNAHTPTEA